MRIISGRLGGRRLKNFKAPWIRPTSDIVKGSIFNKLQFLFPGAQVLDLFSGTGNLSFEALSRGAAQVTAVEKHAGSIKIIRENAQALGVDKELELISDDVLRFLTKRDLGAFNLILIDPPFTEKLADEVMTTLAKNDTHHAELIVVIESTPQEILHAQYGQLVSWDERDFGDKRVTYFRYEDKS